MAGLSKPVGVAKSARDRNLSDSLFLRIILKSVRTVDKLSWKIHNERETINHSCATHF